MKEDTVMGIVFSGMFALGLVLFTKVDTDQHLQPHPVRQHAGRHACAISSRPAIVAGGTLAIVLVKRRDLLLYCFDPAARARHRPAGAACCTTGCWCCWR